MASTMISSPSPGSTKSMEGSARTPARSAVASAPPAKRMMPGLAAFRQAAIASVWLRFQTYMENPTRSGSLSRMRAAQAAAGSATKASTTRVWIASPKASRSTDASMAGPRGRARGEGSMWIATRASFMSPPG